MKIEKQNEHPLATLHYCPRCGSPRYNEHSPISKRCDDCGYTDYFNPKAAVVAVILNNRGELMVARRAHDPAKGTLDLPGGFTDCFETAEESVTREVKEETGLDVKEITYLFSAPNIYPFQGFDVHTMDLFFLCRVDSFAQVQAHDDVSDIYFMKPDTIHPADFGLNSIRQNIPRILEIIRNCK